MNEREQIVARINQINEQLDNGLDNNLEYYRLLGERDGLQQRLATIDNDFSYDDPLSGEYSAVPANDEFLYNNEEQLINSELQQIEAELEAIRAELRDRAVNDSNALTHEEIDNYQRRIIELERRKNELLNNSRSIEPNPTIVEDNNLNRAKEIVDELEKLNKELNKYFSGELTSQFGNEPAEIQRKIANLEEELELLKSKLTPEQLEELNDYINNRGKSKINLLEEAKKIVDKMTELEEELRKYYSNELTDNFGVRSLEINRELEELKNRLEEIKSKLTPAELEELENYIKSKNKKETDKEENKKENKDGKGNKPVPPTPISPTPELPREIPKQKPKKVTKIKKWICNHKKQLIALGIAALAVGTIALAINLGPALIAGKMVSHATAWHTVGNTGIGALKQAILHNANMALGEQLAATYGAHAFSAAGIHTFAGAELAKVASVAAAKVAASIGAMGLGAAALTAGIKGAKDKHNSTTGKEFNEIKEIEKEETHDKSSAQEVHAPWGKIKDEIAESVKEIQAEERNNEASKAKTNDINLGMYGKTSNMSFNEAQEIIAKINKSNLLYAFDPVEEKEDYEKIHNLWQEAVATIANSTYGNEEKVELKENLNEHNRLLNRASYYGSKDINKQDGAFDEFAQAVYDFSELERKEPIGRGR